jgi:hypothetical protein
MNVIVGTQAFNQERGMPGGADVTQKVDWGFNQ